MILHRAFSREVLQYTGAVTVLVLFIFLVIRVVGYLQLAAEGIIPTNSVLTLLVLRLLSHLDIIAPLGVYVAMLLVLGRWSRDREMVVVAAAGLGLSSFLRPTSYLLAVLGLVVSVFSLYLSPLALRTGDNVEHEFRTRSDVTGIIPGVFTENLGGDGVYFVESYDSDENLYHNIFAWTLAEGIEGVVVASSARKTIAAVSNSNFLVLENGTRYEGMPGKPEYAAVQFEAHGLMINENPIPQLRTRLAGWRTLELWKHRRDSELRSELHWRISKIVILPVLMLLALALGQEGPGRSRLLAMIGALVTYFAYANVGGYLVALSRRGTEEPLFLLWVLHFFMAALALYLFRLRIENKALLPNGNKGRS